MTTKIDEIVSKEALEQVDDLIAKLKEANRLQKKVGDNITIKINALTDLVLNPNCGSEVRIAAVEKLKELIPLL